MTESPIGRRDFLKQLAVLAAATGGCQTLPREGMDTLDHTLEALRFSDINKLKEAIRQAALPPEEKERVLTLEGLMAALEKCQRIVRLKADDLRRHWPEKNLKVGFDGKTLSLVVEAENGAMEIRGRLFLSLGEKERKYLQEGLALLQLIEQSEPLRVVAEKQAKKHGYRQLEKWLTPRGMEMMQEVVKLGRLAAQEEENQALTHYLEDLARRKIEHVEGKVTREMERAETRITREIERVEGKLTEPVHRAVDNSFRRAGHWVDRKLESLDPLRKER